MPESVPGVAPAALLTLTLIVTAATATPTSAQTERPAETPPVNTSAEAVLASIEDPAVADVARDVLDRNPRLAAVRARARAAEKVAPQVGSLPDPMAGLTAFLLSPETRVGPQQAMVSLSERFPWFGKLEKREQRALYEAAAVHARADAEALELVTEARTLAYELAFLDEWEEIIELDRATLERYEELARTRYSAGVGLGQSVVKIQAEITRDESRLLRIADRRAEVAAALNALRDRGPHAPLPEVELPDAREPAPASYAALRRLAIEARPAIERAEAEIAAAESSRELAELERYPDVTLGLSYTLVGQRDDEPGRINPPPDNGNDVLGISASVNLPIWQDRIEAGIEEAMERRRAAEHARRAEVAGIERSLGELMERLELSWRQLRLFDDVLVIQAEESLSSAESAYGAGNLNALDLLDAERVLLDVRTSTARTRADWAIALARLEGTVGRPVDLDTPEDSLPLDEEEPVRDTQETPRGVAR